MLNPDAGHQLGNRPARFPIAASRTVAAVLPVPNRAPSLPLLEQIGEADQRGFGKMALYAGLAMLFVRITVLPDLLFTLLHVNTYLLYVVGPPAILGALFTGAIGRTLRHRTAWMWLGFCACMLLSFPFSSWKGGSLELIKSYMLFSLPLLFTVGGLPMRWRDIRATFLTIGAAGVFFCGVASFFAKEDNGRADMQSASTTIGNSNDLASQLLLVLPFLLFIAMDRRRAALIRWSMIAPMGYGLLIVLRTESRGAVVALAVSFLYVLLRASAKQRIAALAIAMALAVSIPIFFGGEALDRLGTMFGAGHTVSADVQEEAKESADARSYLLKQSLIYTVQHPIFGVGPGQFSTFEGKSAKEEGRRGNWHETHNAFTQVSSECGVPAVIFFVLGIGGAFASVSRIYKKALQGGYTEIANTSFCYLLSMVGFLTSIVFLANAYRFYLPAMIGLAIALSAAAEKEMAAGGLKPARESGGMTLQAGTTRAIAAGRRSQMA